LRYWRPSRGLKYLRRMIFIAKCRNFLGRHIILAAISVFRPFVISSSNGLLRVRPSAIKKGETESHLLFTNL
jgi:hypothetical protein